jgi:pyruvate kinase
MTPPGLPRKRTKIVATVGPASRAPEMLRRLILAGVDVFRLNFSHGTHDEHGEVVARIRTIARELDRSVGILQDLSGPKMRLGPIPGDVVQCGLGQEFTLVSARASDSPYELTCTYPNLPGELKPGETVLFADGTVAMTVADVTRGRARLQVTLPGTLRSRQGINLPGSNLTVESLTPKDLQDLDWTARNAADVQLVGLSFVRTAADVVRLRQELAARKCPARIVVKIEKRQAVDDLDAIVAETDAVMVARGDLGVEVAVHRVPAIQKRIIASCNQAHRPVITATQMLNSMEHSSRPTRAEASDVFNAVVDGTDAVMLSGESAIGEYPVEAVSTMARICLEAEAHLERAARSPGAPPARLAGWIEPITEAAVDGAVLTAERLDAPLIIVATESGRTALAVSNRRPTATILALTRTEQIARALTLCWGVTPLVLAEGTSADAELAKGVEWARTHDVVRPGQHVIFLRGQVAGQPRSRVVLAREIR